MVGIAAELSGYGEHYFLGLEVDGTVLIPSPAPTIPVGDVDVTFCDDPLADWRVYSGRMLFERSWEDRDCLMESASPEFYSVYGGEDAYTDEPLSISTTVGYDASDDTFYRDFFVLFRMQSLPTGNTTNLDEHYGYSCKIVADAASASADLRLLEQKTNGREATLAASESFAFSPSTFYDLSLSASGANFQCAIVAADDPGAALANLTATDRSFSDGYVAIADEPSDYGPHYWADLDVAGTVAASPTPDPTRRRRR